MDKFFFFALFLHLAFLILHVQSALQCPDSSLISPCTCKPVNNEENGNVTVSIDCDGMNVTKTTIETVFKELRQRNNIPQDGWIQGMQEFRLFRTEIADLDLSIFFKSQINFLTLERNRELIKITGSNDEKDWKSIDVKSFQIYVSEILNRQGFGDTLKYFTNRMTTLYLVSLQIDNNNRSNDEFLPGIFSLENLKQIFLGNNIVSGRLEGGILTDLWNLRNVTFRDNKISQIGENVFDFADHDNNDKNDTDSNIIANTVFLDFYGNSLDETSFHINSGLNRIRRRTVMYLDQNSFTTLPSYIFQGYLDAHPGNLLYLYGNPLVCNARLSWIKARREDLERRVYGGYCVNDQNKPLFESELIP